LNLFNHIAKLLKIAKGILKQIIFNYLGVTLWVALFVISFSRTSKKDATAITNAEKEVRLTG
jgi:hypothetical protein